MVPRCAPVPPSPVETLGVPSSLSVKGLVGPPPDFWVIGQHTASPRDRNIPFHEFFTFGAGYRPGWFTLAGREAPDVGRRFHEFFTSGQ